MWFTSIKQLKQTSFPTFDEFNMQPGMNGLPAASEQSNATEEILSPISKKITADQYKIGLDFFNEHCANMGEYLYW